MKHSIRKKTFSLIFLPFLLLSLSVGVGFSSWIINAELNKKTTGNVDVNLGNVVEYNQSVNVVFSEYSRNYDYMGCEIILQENRKGDTYNPDLDPGYEMKDNFKFLFRNLKKNNIRVHIKFTVTVEGLKKSIETYLRPLNTVGHNFGWFHRKPETEQQKRSPVKFTRYLSNEKTQKFYIEDNINLDPEQTLTIIFTVYPNNYSEIIDKTLNMKSTVEVNNVTDV